MTPKTDSVAVLREIEREIRDLARRVADYGLAGMTGKSRLDELADRLQTSLAALSAQGECTPNDYVMVKLNKYGLAALKNNHDKLCDDIPKARNLLGDWKQPETDEHGYSKHQLWGLMHDLGPHMGAGGICLFDDIRLPPTLHPAPPGSDAVTEEMVRQAAMVLWGYAQDERANQHLREALTAALAGRTGKGEANGR